ncbi:hypothetical protein SCOR_33940 [Sulfidibacter corallicola]|uniref:Uncharacterized protein n=1 Tax=Sulfidibacter corallicola TaxID=2818388 RepID=A0A8A4TIN0_SULCO|nr:hypothetical protein [Sulfidibacter corallicola]QTD49463.1 hypothetical protein J3U87_28085 [Sulfidibacter corallicola]
MLLANPIGKVRLTLQRPGEGVYERYEMRYGLRVLEGEEHFILEDATREMERPWEVNTLATAPTASTVVSQFLRSSMDKMEDKRRRGFALLDATRPFYPVWDDLLNSFPRELPKSFDEAIEAERLRRERAFIEAQNGRFLFQHGLVDSQAAQEEARQYFVSVKPRKTTRHRKYQELVEDLNQMRLFD